MKNEFRYLNNNELKPFPLLIMDFLETGRQVHRQNDDYR